MLYFIHEAQSSGDPAGTPGTDLVLWVVSGGDLTSGGAHRQEVTAAVTFIRSSLLLEELQLTEVWMNLRLV